MEKREFIRWMKEAINLEKARTLSFDTDTLDFLYHMHILLESMEETINGENQTL